MRLKPEKIDLLCDRIFDALKNDPDCQFIRDESMIHDEVRKTFYEDLKREDDIEEEIREKLEAHRDQISRGQVSFQDLFRKAKQTLGRERNLVF